MVFYWNNNYFATDSMNFLLYSSSTPTLRSLEIFANVSMSGCDEFVHHLETVDGFTPNASDNHIAGFLLFYEYNFQAIYVLHIFQICCLGVKIVKTIHSAKKIAPFLEFFMNICHNSGHCYPLLLAIPQTVPVERCSLNRIFLASVT